MKLQKPFLKVFSLSIFILFIAGFVSYRSKAVKQYPYTANGAIAMQSGDAPGGVLQDTLKRTDTIRPRLIMMSSSKSMILIDEKQAPGFMQMKKFKPSVKPQKHTGTALNDSFTVALPLVINTAVLKSKSTPPHLKDSTNKH